MNDEQLDAPPPIRDVEASFEGGSVTLSFQQFRNGDPSAASALWNRYFERMKSVVRSRIDRVNKSGSFDEEDVALSAFNAFALAVGAGKYQDLEDRDDLWRLLAGITLKRTSNWKRNASRQKRGGGQVVEIFDDAINQGSPNNDPDPAMMTAMSEECRRLFSLLSDRNLELVALWRLEGYTNAEIAKKMKLSRWTIQRMLGLIREIWQGSQEDS